MAIHVIKGDGPPNGITPPNTGVHYIDSTNKDTYMSTGNSSPTDWVLTGSTSSSFTNFLALLDTPTSYNAQAGLVPIVNELENALEFGSQSLITLGDVDSTGLSDNQVLVYDFTNDQKFVPQYRVDWQSQWVPGTYKSNIMVKDQGWVVISNKETDERAAPQPDGASAWALSDTPTWTPGDTTPISIQGLRITVSPQVMTLDGFRFWRATNTGNEEYTYLISDITDPTEVTVLDSGRIPSGAIGWIEVTTAGTFFFEGQVLDIKFATSVHTGSDSWEHQWTLQDDSAGLPNSATYTHNTAHTLVRISTDAISGDVKTDLDLLKTGDQIVFLESSTPTRFNTYEVASTPAYSNGDTVLELSVIRIGNGQSVRINQVCGGRATINTGALPADYVSIPNYWFLNAPDAGSVNGYLLTDWEQTPALNDDAYGVDVRGHGWLISDDWDIVTTVLGGGGGGTGGGGSGADTFLALLDTPDSFAGQGGQFLRVNPGETGLEYIEEPGGSVDSVFGRQGNVVANTGDYSASQTGADTSAQVDQKDIDSIDAHVALPDPHTQYLTGEDLPSLSISYFTGITSAVDGAYLTSFLTTQGNVENSVSASGVTEDVPVLIGQWLADTGFPVGGTLLETGTVFTLDYDSDDNLTDLRIEIGLRSVGGIYTVASTQDFPLSEGRSVSSFTVTLPELDFFADERSFSRLYVIKKEGGGPSKLLTIYQEGSYISRTLTTIPGASIPAAHATSHESGGNDQVDHDLLINAIGTTSHADLDIEQATQDAAISQNTNDILPLQQNIPPTDGQVAGRYLRVLQTGAGTFTITDTGSYNTNGTFRFTQQSTSGSGSEYFGEATVAGLVLTGIALVRNVGHDYAVSDTITLDIPGASENVPAVIQVDTVVPGQSWEEVIFPPSDVTSWNSRTGDVVPESSDYDADQIDDAATVKKFATQVQLDQIATNTSEISDNADDILDNANAIAANKDKLIFGASTTKAEATSTGVKVTGALDFDTAAVSIGNNAGSGGISSVAIGPGAGETTQGNNSVALGNTAGQTGQGAGSIAIGRGAGLGSQGAKSIIISAKNTSSTNNTNDNSIHLETGNGSMIYNGAGVNDPMAFSMKVDAPDVSTDAFTMTDGNQGAEKIMVSDAAGVAAWREQSVKILDAVPLGNNFLTGEVTLVKNGNVYAVFSTGASVADPSANLTSDVLIPVANRPPVTLPLIYRVSTAGWYRINIRNDGTFRYNQFYLANDVGEDPSVVLEAIQITTTATAAVAYYNE